LIGSTTAGNFADARADDDSEILEADLLCVKRELFGKDLWDVN
jgi:hypothetical protein